MMAKKKMAFLVVALSITLIFSGCATVRHPVPKALIGKAEVNNLPQIRAIAGFQNPILQENVIRSISEEAPGDYPPEPDGTKVYPMLVLSGGSANGAYGAGLLKGWSDEGSRPKFKVVTGVSTGAITAPLAFLGKKYDGAMEKLYTTLSTKDVMRSKGPFSILFGDSFASNEPLRLEVRKIITPEMLKEIAAEHKRGRRLFVGTALLDSQRFVIWDMGEIASRGQEKLFEDVTLASAAIPAIFPPMYIHVEADGKAYDEMHVDGGTVTQMFTLYKLLENAGEIAKKLGVDPSKVKGKVYIIRNGYVEPGYKVIKDELADIAAGAFDTIINYQGIGDTYRIYSYMQKRGNDYNLAFIPGDFRPKFKEDFDTHAMKELFQRGYQDGLAGYQWHKAPPGLIEGGTE